MAETTQTPPTWQPPEGADPKAAAKAAKAYAKASRPWYKKKRWIGSIVIAAFIAIAVASGGGSSDDDSLKSSTDSTSTSTKSDTKDSQKEPKGASDAKVGSKGSPASRGTAVQNKSAKYAIENVEVRDSLGQFADKPSGKYVVVTLTAENVKDETIQISSEDFKLLVGGVEIDASDQAYVLDDAFSYDDLSPGLKRSGKIVFDVAPKNAGNGVLLAQAFLSTDDPVYLKLK